MRNLVVMLGVWVIGLFGIDIKKDKAVKEVHKAELSSCKGSLQVVEQSSVSEPEPCNETPCDSNGYFRKGITEGLKRCPVHKDNPCLPEPCPPHKLEVLEVGYVNNKTLHKVIAKCGTDCTEVVEIGVKPYKVK